MKLTARGRHKQTTTTTTTIIIGIMQGPARQPGTTGRGARECAETLLLANNNNNNNTAKDDALSDSYAPFVPTSLRQVDRIMKLCGLDQDDTLCDLGCGDGALLRHCAKVTGCRTIGVEVDSALVILARSLLVEDHTAAANENDDRHVIVEALVGPFCDTDVRFLTCTVVFLHLVEPQLVALKPYLRGALLANPTTRIVAQRFAIPGLQDLLLETIPCMEDVNDEYFGTLGQAFLYGIETKLE